MEPRQRTSGARFGTFEVWFDSGELRSAGLKIRVQQQPLKVLQILLESPGKVVSRDDLRNRLWANESFGDFDQAVNIAIGKLRSALGDSAESPRYIETLPKHGYRFIAEVSIVDSDGRSGRQASGSPTSSARTSASGDLNLAQADVTVKVATVIDAPTERRWTARRIAFATALSLGLSILAVLLIVHWLRRPTGIRSLAVLPLDNFSDDASQNYFADGMTDELITDLAQIRALRVVSRTSVMMYKATHKPPRGDRERVESGRCSGGLRRTLWRSGADHGAIDPGARGQAPLGGNLPGECARYVGPPESGSARHCRGNPDRSHSTRTGGPQERKEGRACGLRGVSQRALLVEQTDSRRIEEGRRLFQRGYCQGSKLRSCL
jgi:DNA-binding winged helix-turn-helix (wHTH) protein